VLNFQKRLKIYLRKKEYQKNRKSYWDITLKKLIELIIKGIVDKPEKIEINQVIGEKTLIFEVKIDSDDIGKVIGKQGRNIKSIRTIINAAAQKEDKQVIIEIAN